MTISDINVDEALERVRQQLKEDRTVSPSLRAAIDVLMLLVKLMADRLKGSGGEFHTQRRRASKQCDEPWQGYQPHNLDGFCDQVAMSPDYRQ